MSTPETTHEVVVVGSGFAGLGQLLALRRAGITDVVLLEKADALGGTWRDNTCPGCACDIPSHMYSLSDVPNPDWSPYRRAPSDSSPQPEIRDYLERLADDHDLRRHVRFGQEMTGATWDEEDRTWAVHTRGGTTWRARFLVFGTGALHLPHVPALPGAETFAGPTFHSARWDHDVDLRGRRVAVIGTGASAIQFVPEIAGVAAEVQLYQRTPAWVLPRTTGRSRSAGGASSPGTRPRTAPTGPRCTPRSSPAPSPSTPTRRR